MLNSFILRFFFRIAYWYINTVDKKGEVTFLNYGYVDRAHKLDLDASDEKNRYAIQLYHLVATSVDVQHKDILEIACGRGGGLNYMVQHLDPATATGIDLNQKAIRFCKQNYKDTSINFLQGDAENIQITDASFDVVINIESSHAYPHMDRFLSEVHRVLRHDGYFLLADFRTRSELKKLNHILKKSNMIIIEEKLITDQVLEALKLIHDQRVAMINSMVPWILRGMSWEFVALEGTMIFNKFANHELEYVFYVLQKK